MSKIVSAGDYVNNTYTALRLTSDTLSENRNSGDVIKSIGSIFAPILVSSGNVTIKSVGIAFSLALYNHELNEVKAMERRPSEEYSTQEYFDKVVDLLGAVGGILCILPFPHAKAAGIALGLGVAIYKESKDKSIEELIDIVIDLINEVNDIIYDYLYGEIDQETNTKFNTAQNWVPRSDPLTLDLDGDGLETIAAGKVLFDHDGDGIKNGTGWIGSDDGFLVFDRNGNGIIDNGTELFGDSTDLYTGGKAKDGFAALAQEDTNGDGKVDAEDANWGSLKVWRDLNQDGISQEGELFTLAELGIESFDVDKTRHSQTLENGNQIADTGSYTRTDGTSGKMGDINLVDDTFVREFTEEITLADGVADLPEVRGSGKLRDLRQAASLSPELQDTLTLYSQATTRSGQRVLLDQLLEKWANTSADTATLRQRAAGHYAVNYQNLGNYKASDPDWESIVTEWERKLAIVEAFNGRYFYSLPNSGINTSISGITVKGTTNGLPQININLSVEQVELIEASYRHIQQSVSDGITMQTRYQSMLDLIEIDLDGESGLFDYSALNARIENNIAENAVDGMWDLIEFYQKIGRQLEGWNGVLLIAKWVRALPVTDELLELYQSLSVLSGKEDSDTSIKGSSDEDILIARRTGEYIRAGAGNDVLVGSESRDDLYGEAGDDIIYGGAGNDYLYGGDGDDILYGDDGRDTLYGGKGNDMLYGGDGNDGLNGGNGDDILYGEDGNDVLYGDAGNDILYGGAGNDSLYGGDGNDILYGGAGDDTLNGGAGSDIYVLDANSGHDTIINIDWTEGKKDIIQLSDEWLGYYWSRIGNNLTITMASNSNNAFTLHDFFDEHGARATHVDELHFANGLVETQADLQKMVLNNAWGYLYGFSGDDVITGSVGDNRIYGGGGNDIIHGGGGYDSIWGQYGNNLLDGGEDNDDLHGGMGNDFFISGTGNDTISMSAGVNVIAFNQGDGRDTVYGYTGKNNTLSLGGGIVYDDIGLLRQGNTLMLTIGDNECIYLERWYDKRYNADNKSITNLQFILEGSADYDADSSDALYNKKIQQFDFAGLVAEFDRARAADSTLNYWSITSSLMDFYLAGSDTEAIGGELAYVYGKEGDFTSLSTSHMQQILQHEQFGKERQGF